MTGAKFIGATTRIVGSRCLNCGKLNDAATGLNTDSAPEPGDITICLACGHLMTYADDLTLREPTAAEMVEIAGDKRIVDMQRLRGKVGRKPMTIQHAEACDPDGPPFVFAELAPVSCSICALKAVTKREVEAFANVTVDLPMIGGWVAVDKSKGEGFGSATPNECKHAAGRQHWFLIDALNAARLFGAEADDA